MVLDNSNKVRDYSKELFTKGPNCAECVLKALAESDITSLSADDVRFATGFGGGIGKYGLTCGALTGAVIAASSVYGRRDPMALQNYEMIKNELAGDNGVYDIFNKMVREFEEKVGSTVCKEIIDVSGENAATQKFKKCQNAVGVASEIAYKYITMKG